MSLSDTVGFIRDLPHGLVDAFEATLQEAADADLLLHVVDAANPNHLEQIDEVQRVLREIGAAEVPQLLVFNKLDGLDAARRPHALKDTLAQDGRELTRVFVSARTGEGLDALRAELAARVQVMADTAAPAAEDARGLLPIGHNHGLHPQEFNE